MLGLPPEPVKISFKLRIGVCSHSLTITTNKTSTTMNRGIRTLLRPHLFMHRSHPAIYPRRVRQHSTDQGHVRDFIHVEDRCRLEERKENAQGSGRVGEASGRVEEASGRVEEDVGGERRDE